MEHYPRRNILTQRVPVIADEAAWLGRLVGLAGALVESALSTNLAPTPISPTSHPVPQIRFFPGSDRLRRKSPFHLIGWSTLNRRD
jgi:hypothetical protein